MRSNVVAGLTFGIAIAAVLAPALLAADPGLPAAPEIAFEKFVLPNGLTVVVHEDHKAPIVAVNVWYHVGSKNEKAGKTGFAHLFEHLMFNGSEHFNDDYFKALEKVGATELNGTTNEDRTNYFQNVPASALDFALFMESDRMGRLLAAIDQAKLDEQRGVVQNEKRQGDNQPYGRVRYLISENVYPAGHPYSWPVIGSMEDLQAASLDDVREWFKTYYGPNNAVLVIAGDVSIADVKSKVEKWFGDIPPGPPIAKHTEWVAKMKGAKRGALQDRVPQARIYMVWNTPQWGAPESTLLDIAGDVLAAGKSSRLYKRLVYDDQIATDVFAYQSEDEIGGNFIIQATVKPGGSLAAVEKAIHEELARLIHAGPTADELSRVKTPVLRVVHAGYRAHRRLRRQVRHPGVQYGVWRGPGVLQDAAGSRGGCDAARSPGRRRRLALRRRLHPRGASVPATRRGGRRRQSLQPPRSRKPARRRAAGDGANNARQRAQRRRGEARWRSPGSSRPARRCWLCCGRAVARHGLVGHGHA